MKRISSKILIYLVMLPFIILNVLSIACAEELMVFSGAAFKKPLDDLIQSYDKAKVSANYGGVTAILTQLSLGRQGDVFVVPSPDVMEQAVQNGLVKKESVRSFVYAVPVMVVKKGNPKGIHSIEDLLRPDVRFAMANPEMVYIGRLAAEIFDRNLPPDKVDALRKKVQTYVDDISKLLSYLLMDQVDAVLGFDFLKGWAPNRVDIVKLKPNEVIRIGNGQIGVTTSSKDPQGAEKFIGFVLSGKGQEVFKKYGYLTSLKETYAFLGAKKPVGGVPQVGQEWISR
ncbi:molybdate ABC transporter substrate-binding protein [Dissulfurimicrobium hydrothermale]|uniref:molybdate ABC transporter substrate-binding protein n=1 Tax=Dissulfurimicrobium hydrothermale TaxID=1750598 RepID=UPI001EDAFA81|nr:molybdate ABC transporter substrate-binding protein [Dissulfurimicrobium hydrothermale]UKL13665.1 molybdate ABC transporter substrate-binding protein [Dissulfurimicrobium hydrothermale]